MFFFFNDTATTEIYTLSLHDALPIWNTCLARYVLSSLTEKRDRWNNIIGHRPLEPELEDAMIHIIPTMMRDLSPMNVNPEVSESTICALRDAFQSEVDALVDSGLLIPKGWQIGRASCRERV